MLQKSLFLILISFLTLSCVQQTGKLPNILAAYKLPPQTATFSAEKPFEFVGKHGSRISVNPKDLVASSEIDSIRIELIELITLKDLLVHDVQTVSDKKWLESGGSFKINLFSGDKALILKKGASIKVTLPRIVNGDMDLFYGDRMDNGQMDWDLSDHSLQERRYQSYVDIRNVVPDDLNNRFYGITEGYFIETSKLDSLGLRTQTQMEKLVQTDSISGYKIIGDSLVGYKGLSSKGEVGFDDEVYDRYQGMLNTFYAAINLNKLGWLNVDRFYPEVKERFNLSLKLDKSYNLLRAYVMDKERNTLLDISSSTSDYENRLTVDLPSNHKFNIIVLTIENDEIYAYEKSVRLDKNRIMDAKPRKMSKEKLSRLFQ